MNFFRDNTQIEVKEIEKKEKIELVSNQTESSCMCHLGRFAPPK
jgi:hypothetical protein